MDDELARAVSEGDTVETLREKVRGAAAARKGSRPPAPVPAGDPRHAALAPRRPAPEVLVESETTSALRDYARYLAASGIDPEKEDWAKLAEEARPGAERRVKEYLLLDAIAEREEIEVSETELEAEFKRAAARARGRALRCCGSRWRKPAGWTPFATRCASRGPWTS